VKAESNDLQRFLIAQAGRMANNAPSGVRTGSPYGSALIEIRNGHKSSCWMWYVFPQLAIFSGSPMSQYYSLKTIEEARSYLHDAFLGTRYRESLVAIAEQLSKNPPVDLKVLMGDPTGNVDVKKLLSSVTLFACVSIEINDIPLVNLCKTVLEKANTQGYPLCKETLNQFPQLKGGLLDSMKRLLTDPGVAPTPVSAGEQAVEKTSSNQVVALRVAAVLEEYIAKRAKEPSHFYQGLFKGYSKHNKLEAAACLYKLVKGTRGANVLVQKLKLGKFIHPQALGSIDSYLSILRQGRLGKALREIAVSDAYRESTLSLKPLKCPRHPVRGLILWLIDWALGETDSTLRSVTSKYRIKE
jgi:uncharacterized protein (DUF1810 family)